MLLCWRACLDVTGHDKPKNGTLLSNGGRMMSMLIVGSDGRWISILRVFGSRRRLCRLLKPFTSGKK